MADKKNKLETIGRILTSGFGDRVLIGILMGLLDSVTPERCYEYIRDNLSLLQWASDTDWQRYRKWARQANASDITKDRVIAELRKYNPELLSLIINTQDGEKWLQAQIDELKEKLEIK